MNFKKKKKIIGLSILAGIFNFIVLFISLLCFNSSNIVINIELLLLELGIAFIIEGILIAIFKAEIFVNVWYIMILTILDELLSRIICKIVDIQYKSSLFYIIEVMIVIFMFVISSKQREKIIRKTKE